MNHTLNSAEILWRRRINRNPKLSLEILAQMKAHGGCICLETWAAKVLIHNMDNR